MGISRLIKTFSFTEEDRRNVVFSDAAKIRLDPKANAVKLKADVNGDYPLTAGIYVRSYITNPASARKLIGFECYIEHGFVDNVKVTGVQFRLHDGTNQYYYDGAAWVISVVNWNDEATVSTNINTFNILATKQWGVVVNISTTDKKVTPTLFRVKIAYEARVNSFIEDIVYRSLARDLRAKLRPVTSMVYTLPANSSTVNLQTVIDSTGLQFAIGSVDAVFNRTDDPNLHTDIFQSYDTNTKIITLNQTVGAGKLLQIDLLYIPEVVVLATHNDYIEVEKIPAVVVTGINQDPGSELQQPDWVANRAGNTAIYLPPPMRIPLNFNIELYAPTGVDVLRMVDEFIRYVQENPLLRSDAIDEQYRLQCIDEFNSGTTPNNADVHMAMASFKIHDVLVYRKAAITNKPIVKTLTVSTPGNVEFTVDSDDV